MIFLRRISDSSKCYQLNKTANDLQGVGETALVWVIRTGTSEEVTF